MDAYLDDYIDAHLCPGQLQWVSAGDDLDQLPIDADGPVVDNFDISLERPQHRVVLQQMRRLHSSDQLDTILS